MSETPDVEHLAMQAAVLLDATYEYGDAKMGDTDFGRQFTVDDEWPVDVQAMVDALLDAMPSGGSFLPWDRLPSSCYAATAQYGGVHVRALANCDFFSGQVFARLDVRLK